MREIKFRAWHKTWSAQPIDETDWHRPKQKINGMQFVIGLGYSSHGNMWVHLGDWKSSIAAKDVELMQYTGLKDKNGKEIYEGDIINDCGDKYEVIFHKGTFCYKMLEHEYHLFGDEVEIIGSIYEHPHLLTNEK